MTLLAKFPVYLKLRSSSKTQFKLITQNIFNGFYLTANLNYSAVCDTSNANFPHLKHASEQEKILEPEYTFTKYVLAGELCEECCFAENISQSKKVSLLNCSIETLNSLDLIPSPKYVIKNMLSYLEPFPFYTDDKLLIGSIRKRHKEPEEITISVLRNSIEKQYLAWKFDVSCEMIERILMHLRCSLYIGRSLQSLRRNLELLETCQKIEKINMFKQLYLLSQMAFDANIINDFQDSLLGLDWFQIGVCHPAMLSRPYHFIMLRLKALQEEGFSNEQLKKAFPLLYRPSLDLMKMLIFFKDLPDIYKHRDDPYFLRLLLLYSKGEFKDNDWSRTNYEDLKGELSKLEKFSRGFSELMKFHRVTIGLYAKMKLGANDTDLEAMKSNFKKYTFSFSGLSDTLLFLEENKFTFEEIRDCITIIFYPRHAIEKVLNTIANEEEKLSKLGFVNGRVDKNTSDFECGSKLRNKTLHLCLYYIQKANNFSIGQSST